MTILATFIGVDRHAADDIRDLTGARRDAIALSSIFKDTLPDAAITVLTDEKATNSAVRKMLAETLGAATEDDIAIFAFSGHGSTDHRLVLYDTSRQDLQGTTISMHEISELFTTSKAGAIICILDCCFSGEAPGRVLEGTPRTRDPMDPFNEIIGSGRVLIAACDAQEVAYEHPQLRMGLLTSSIVNSLCNGTASQGIGQFLDEVLNIVRAEAAKIGITQTPHLINNVSGGLTLPPFQKGEHFKKAFPEQATKRVTADIGDLKQFGLPDAILSNWKTLYPTGLNELQIAAINDGGVLNDQSTVVVAPTSSGKTFVGELATAKVISENKKAVFLLPYKALVNEKYDQFTSLYGEKLGYRVIRCSGDYSDQTGKLLQGKYDLAVLTYEMFLSLALERQEILHSIGLVVIDEVHFITDPNRGITVELILTHLLLARAKGIHPQLVCLSAVVGDLNGFDDWLECNKVVSHKRPIPLIEGVIDRTGLYQFVDVDGVVRTEQFIPRHEIRVRGKELSAQDIIVPLAQKLLIDDEKAIIFRNVRGKAQGCAAYLAADLGLPPASDAIDALPQSDSSTASDKLRTCLEGGTAFHTSNLTREEREVVERAFRDPTGKVRMLAATTTVAAGINTPADTVIIAENEFRGEDGRAFTIAEYKNMAGRAGRLGIRDRGRSIIYAETAHQRQMLFSRYVQGRLENLHSSFDQQHVDTWLLRLLVQARAVPRNEVASLLARSYGGYLQNRTNPTWQSDMIAVVETKVDHMLRLGLAEEENGKISLTLLGQACGRSSLAFSSAMRLVEVIRSAGNDITPMLVVTLVQCLDEMDRTYTPVGAKGAGKEQEWISRLGLLAGRSHLATMQRYAGDTRTYVARCKRACILHDWVAGMPLNEIERRYTTNLYYAAVGYGDIASIATATRYHLRSAAQIVMLLIPDPQGFGEDMEALLRQLEFGIPKEALPLIGLPRMRRGDILALHGAGFNDPDAVQALDTEQLLEILGRDGAARLSQAA